MTTLAGFSSRPWDPSSSAPTARPATKYAAAVVVAGRLVAQLGAPAGLATWRIRRLVVTASAAPSTGTPCNVYVGTLGDPASLADLTDSGDRDVAEYTQPLFVDSSQAVYVEWPALSTGSAGVRMEYDERTG